MHKVLITGIIITFGSVSVSQWETGLEKCNWTCLFFLKRSNCENAFAIGERNGEKHINE